MFVRVNLFNGLYKRSTMGVRAAKYMYLDKGSTYMKESWATIRTHKSDYFQSNKLRKSTPSV